MSEPYDLVYVLEALHISNPNGSPHRVVKIGHTTNLHRRMADFFTMIPTELNLWGIIAGGETQEQRLHQALGAARFRGEWFHVTPSVFTVLQRQIMETPKHLPQRDLWQRYIGKNSADIYRTAEVKLEVDGRTLEIVRPSDVFKQFESEFA